MDEGEEAIGENGVPPTGDAEMVLDVGGSLLEVEGWGWPVACALLVVAVMGVGASLVEAGGPAVGTQVDSVAEAPQVQALAPAVLSPSTTGLSQAEATGAIDRRISAPASSFALAAQSSGLITTTRTISYTYDPLGRLTAADYSTGEFFAYQYDARRPGRSHGNRTAMTDTAGAHTYAYDAANRLTSVNGIAYTWDDNGNLLSDGARSFTYDAANRLTQVVSGTFTTEYTTSGDGVRLAQSVNGVSTQYVVDQAASLPQVLQEQKAGTQVAYLYGLEAVATYDSGAWAYQHPDGLGSVRQQTDGAGQVTMARVYDPFGGLLAQEGGQAGQARGSLGFAGEQAEAAAGLIFLRARYYDPATGRFLTRDPYPAYALAPSTLHRYAYVG